MNTDLAAELNAFITVVRDPAPGGAGPLAGVMLGVKDLIETKGLRTTAGAAILRDHVPRRDAACVTALRRAGAVVVGKTNTHEFAYGTTNDNPHFGATKNPWNLALSTGGSSGGSAAAVAAGVVPLALGTDTAGSIRIPSALCGAVGLKPTTGLVSTAGVIPLSPTLDCVGPIAATVELAARAFAALTGRALAREPGVRGLKIGIPEHVVFDRVHPEIERLVRAALRVLEARGCVLQEIAVPELNEVTRIGVAITRVEAAEWHGRHWFPARAAEYGADVRAKLEAGAALPGVEYVRAQQDRERVRRAVRRALRRVDVIAGPTVPVPAFRNAEAPLADTYRLTYPWNIAFLPAITVPCGLTTDGLPAGLQLAGAPRAEARLLAAAALYEDARGPWPAPAVAQARGPRQN